MFTHVYAYESDAKIHKKNDIMLFIFVMLHL